MCVAYSCYIFFLSTRGIGVACSFQLGIGPPSGSDPAERFGEPVEQCAFQSHKGLGFPFCSRVVRVQDPRLGTAPVLAVPGFLQICIPGPVILGDSTVLGTLMKTSHSKNGHFFRAQSESVLVHVRLTRMVQHAKRQKRPPPID